MSQCESEGNKNGQDKKKNNNKLRKLVETKSNITEFYMSMKKNR